MASVCLAGPSAAVPVVVPGAPGRLPADLTVTVLTWAAIITGTAGVGCGLLALARGWRPPPWWLFGGGLLATAVLTLVPLAGSTDALDYAIYGRIAATGHNPWLMTPARLLRMGDPVGALAPTSWRHARAVYGPMAIAVFALASLAGGASMAITVSIIKAVSGLSFVLAACALDRVAGSDPARRARVHLLWTLNPLMLWNLVGGAHVDVIATALTVAAILALRRTGIRRGAPAGALLAAAVAVKVPFVLAAAGLVWAARRSPGTLIAGVTAGSCVLGPACLLAGTSAARAVADSHRSRSVINPWRPFDVLLHTTARATTSFELLVVLAGVAVTALAWRAMAAGPAVTPAVVPAFALTLGWVVTSPVQHPWYDAMLFPLMALLPRTPLDGLMIARFGVASLAYVPGMPVTLRPAWLESFVHGFYDAWLTPRLLDVIIVAAVLALVLSRGSGRLQSAVPT
jgi:hypothetical protein